MLVCCWGQANYVVLKRGFFYPRLMCCVFKAWDILPTVNKIMDCSIFCIPKPSVFLKALQCFSSKTLSFCSSRRKSRDFGDGGKNSFNEPSGLCSL